MFWSKKLNFNGKGLSFYLNIKTIFSLILVLSCKNDVYETLMNKNLIHADFMKAIKESSHLAKAVFGFIFNLY